MTDLTKDWKDGKLEEGNYYIKLNTGVVVIDYYRWNEDFDEYSRYIFDYHNDDDIATVIQKVPDYNLWQNVLNTADMEHKANNKLLENVERLEKENKELKKQVNHLSKTQARQFMDNQKLQVRAEKAKDVVDITTAKKIKQFKELLKDLQSEAIDALTAIQNDCESDDFSIFNYPEVQTFYTLSEKIDEELKR